MSTKKDSKEEQTGHPPRKRILEESSSIEDTEEEQVIPTVYQGGVQPLQNVKKPFDQQSWLKIEKLKIGTTANYKIFRPGFLIYKKEENGRRFLVEKIEGKVKQYLLVNWKMDGENLFFPLLSENV